MGSGERVLRYDLDCIGGVKTFEIPLPATILTVASRENHISIWALVNPKSKAKRTLQAVAMPPDMEMPKGYRVVRHLGSAIVGNVAGGGSLFATFEPAQWTFHVFEVRPEEDKPEGSDDYGGGFDYRIVRERNEGAEVDTYGEWRYAIHEVYYKTDGAINMMTVNEVGVHGNSEQQMKDGLKLYATAFDKPVLTYPDDFPEGV